MTVAGSIYGVVLNDAQEQSALADQFGEKPYAAAPMAPVVYMKPRTAVTQGAVVVPSGMQLVASPTLALLFGRDATRVDASRAWDHVGAVALAIDLSLPQKDYYRPAVAQKNGDGFLPLGDFMRPVKPARIALSIDGKPVFDWTLDRLVRSIDTLIADLSTFMTLRAGDVLLVGLPGDAPTVGAGHTLAVTAEGLPALSIRMQEAGI